VHQVAPTQMPLVMSKGFSTGFCLVDSFQIQPDRVIIATGNCDDPIADTPKGLAQTCVKLCISSDVSHQADGCEHEDQEACNTAFMMVKNGLSGTNGAKLKAISEMGRNSNLSLLALSLSKEDEQPCIHWCIAGRIVHVQVQVQVQVHVFACLHARARTDMHSCEAGDIRCALLSPEEGTGGKLVYSCRSLSDVCSCLSELTFGLDPKQWRLEKSKAFITMGSLLLCGTSKRLREWERESGGWESSRDRERQREPGRSRARTNDQGAPLFVARATNQLVGARAP